MSRSLPCCKESKGLVTRDEQWKRCAVRYSAESTPSAPRRVKLLSAALPHRPQRRGRRHSHHCCQFRATSESREPASRNHGFRVCSVGLLVYDVVALLRAWFRVHVRYVFGRNVSSSLPVWELGDKEHSSP